ncbi:MAG: MOSC domain-containing protein [Bauldia sp.]|nr:MOSC domain-containing protein [Bauldia sp.]
MTLAADRADLLPPEPEIIPAQRLSAQVEGTYVVPAKPVASVPVAALQLEHEGPVGDTHVGFVRPSSSREPWYPRGTTIRHGRHLSIVSVEELAEIARRMALPELRAEWIGATLLLSGVPRLSLLPPATRIMIPGGASVVVEKSNGPCRGSGASIAEHFPERSGLDLLFPKVARHLRGIVATVERPGTIRPGDTLEVYVPEHWVYRG